MVHLNLLDQPALVAAIFHNDLEQTKELVVKGEDVNFQDSEGRSPLHAAAFVGNGEIADFLLLSGARVNKKDAHWITPLHRACRNCHDDAVEVLLRHQCDVLPRDRNWQTPLHYCATYDAARCAEYLLPVIKEGVNCCDRQGRTPLHLAAYHGNIEMVEVLLQFKADVNARDKKERRAIHWASFSGHWDIVRLLVLSGADANPKDKEWLTPLHCAAANGQITVCRYLFGPEVGTSKGMDVNCRCQKGNTPLHVAANNGKDKIAELLLDLGAEIDARNSQDFTPLHYASASTDGTSSMELLIRRGADVNVRSVDGRTALHLTAVYGRFSRAQTLVASGALIDLLDNSGNSPLHVAARYGHDLLMKKLIENKADVNKRGENGLTPLHLGAFQGYSDSVRLLIENGASSGVLDDFGRSPLHLAALSPKEKSSCVKSLLENGANSMVKDKYGRQPLHNACLHGSFNQVETLCRVMKDCNCQDKDGRTPLHMVCLANSDIRDQEQIINCAKLLLSKLANPMKLDKFGYSCLHYAAYEGHSAVCDLLLNVMKLQAPPRTDASQLTPMHLAAMRGHPKTLEVLLIYFAQQRPPVVLRKLSYDTRKGFPVGAEIDSRGLTPLHLAGAGGHSECVRVLMLNSNRPGILITDRKKGMNPLHVAAGFGHVNCLKHMLGGSDFEASQALRTYDKCKRTCLMLGISSQSVDASLYLIEQGVSVGVADVKGRSCLHRAAAFGLEKVCSNLLASGLDPMALDAWQRTCLHYAAQSDHVSVMELLLGEIVKRNLNATDNSLEDSDGFTPLHWAAYRAGEQCLQLFLDYLKPTKFTGNIFTPLHCAVMSGKEINVTLIIERLGKRVVDEVDESGRSALHLAAALGHEVCLRILIESGAKIDCVDSEGRTSLSYAAQNGHISVIETLLKSGADFMRCDRLKNTALHHACIENEEEAACALIDHPTCTVEFLDIQNEEGKTGLHLAASGGLVAVVERLLLAGANVWLSDENERTPALSCASSSDVADCLELLLYAMMPIDGPRVSKRLSQRLSCGGDFHSMNEDILPPELSKQLVTASVTSNAELYESVSLDISDFLAGELRKIKPAEKPNEKLKKRLRSFETCISRLIIFDSPKKSLDLIAALLSVLLDAAVTRRKLFSLSVSEDEFLCTMCSFYLKNSPIHILDVLLQTELLGTKDAGLVISLLRSAEGSNSVILKNTSVIALKLTGHDLKILLNKCKLEQFIPDQTVPFYLKLVVVAKRVQVVFENKDYAAVYKVVKKAEVPAETERFLLEQKILPRIADGTWDDLTSYLLSDGVLDESSCQTILDALVSQQSLKKPSEAGDGMAQMCFDESPERVVPDDEFQLNDFVDDDNIEHSTEASHRPADHQEIDPVQDGDETTQIFFEESPEVVDNEEVLHDKNEEYQECEPNKQVFNVEQSDTSSQKSSCHQENDVVQEESYPDVFEDSYNLKSIFDNSSPAIERKIESDVPPPSCVDKAAPEIEGKISGVSSEEKVQIRRSKRIVEHTKGSSLNYVTLFVKLTDYVRGQRPKSVKRLNWAAPYPAQTDMNNFPTNLQLLVSRNLRMTSKSSR